MDEASKNQTEPSAEKNANGVVKRSGSKTVIIIIVVVLAILGAGGYFVSRFFAEKAGEQIAEKLLESGTGAKVDIDNNGENVKIETDEGSLEYGSNAEWPEDLPNNVPKISGGSITAASKVSDSDSGNAWTISMADISKEEYEAYQKSLIAAGWQEESSYTSSSSMSQYGDGSNMVVLVHTQEDSVLTISVSKKYAE